MKIALWSLLYLCLGHGVATAQVTPSEFRVHAIQRFGEPVLWNDLSEKFPKVLPSLTQTGQLSTVRIGQIKSITPYDFKDGQPQERPQIIDDVFYESLMLEDPVDGTERLYPLLAQALRVSEGWTQVTFELNPQARFQDGSPVTGLDVINSYQVFTNAHPQIGTRLSRAIASASVSAREVRFSFTVNGQAARDVVFELAKMKIVRANRSGISRLGGISVDYMATGPYRISQLGSRRLSLIKDPFYWGSHLNTRRGFFNFRGIDVRVFDSLENARLSLQNDVSNFYVEPQPSKVHGLAQDLLNKNVPIQLIQEPQAHTIQMLPVFAFDIRRPLVSDVRVREGLLLFYDFNRINQIISGSLLKRPGSVLENSRLAPVGYPTATVRSHLESCDLPEAGKPFDSYGNNLYFQLGDQRVRRLTAMRSLQKAGYSLIGGRMVRKSQDGVATPLILSVLVENQDQVDQMEIFRNDLLEGGVGLDIHLKADREEFLVASQTGDYDIVVRYEQILTRDRWPQLDLTVALFAPLQIPCIDNILTLMKQSNPLGYEYRWAAEALARIEQAMYLGIFPGVPSNKSFFLDHRIQVPAGLSVEKPHLYGYWRD